MSMSSRPLAWVYQKEWIKHNGYIPQGYHIHHIDGNPWNNHISNLQCVSPKQHYWIHKNQGDIGAARLLKWRAYGVRYNRYPIYDDGKLRTMHHGPIKVPIYAWAKGIRPEKVVLMASMDWVIDVVDTYYDDIEEKVEQLLSELNDFDRYIIENFYGINCEKKKWKQIAKITGYSERGLKKRKERIIKKLK